MHRTHSRNCRTLPILVAGLSALTLLSSASIDAAPQAAAADTRYERVVPSPDGIGKRYMGREIAGVMGWEGRNGSSAKAAHARSGRNCFYGN